MNDLPTQKGVNIFKNMVLCIWLPADIPWQLSMSIYILLWAQKIICTCAGLLRPEIQGRCNAESIVQGWRLETDSP